MEKFLGTKGIIFQKYLLQLKVNNITSILIIYKLGRMKSVLLHSDMSKLMLTICHFVFLTNTYR